jgi:hypothetical protein
LADDSSAALLAEIRSAFAQVTRGAGTSLHEAEGIDNGLTGEPLAKERERDTDTHWTQVPPEHIEAFFSVLGFMDAEGFRYYIPAYMTWTLQHYRSSNSLSSDNTIYALWPNTQRADQRYALFSDAQKTCIARFLWYMATVAEDGFVDAYAATRALEDHWYPCLPERG